MVNPIPSNTMRLSWDTTDIDGTMSPSTIKQYSDTPRLSMDCSVITHEILFEGTNPKGECFLQIDRMLMTEQSIDSRGVSLFNNKSQMIATNN